MNIEDMIYNGASEEEVAAALNAIYDEKRKQEEALRAKEQAQKESKEKEALKAEGRAYLINALIAYSEAFDLLDEGETWDEEDVAKAEEAIKKFEEMVPMYIKLAEMQEELRRGDIDPDSFFKGLF